MPRKITRLIFYRQTQDASDIVRVIHGARSIDRVLDEGNDS
jgi:plasmid stabilization system protein ParE